MKKLSPLFDLVIVEVDDSRKEKNGLVLPKEIQPDIAEGRCVGFGPDVPEATKQEIEMCDGGAIYAAQDHEARSYESDGAKYLFIQAKDLMGAVFLGAGDRLPRIQSALGKWILMEWEEAKDTMLGGRLVRPVQRAKAHFTGRAIMVGPLADEVEPDKRYFFEQFSDFKSWSEGGKRYAFVPHSAIYCEIPARDSEVSLAPSEVSSEEFCDSMSGGR